MSPDAHANDWQRFFDAVAAKYLRWEFTANTVAEVDFILRQLKPAAGSQVLDVGCGVGRHTIELARRGFDVTGIDLSLGMLNQAVTAARAAGVWERVRLIQADATYFHLPAQYDLVICLCEGAFSLVGAGEDAIDRDGRILGNVFRALRPGGRFMLTALNALRAIRRASPEDVAAGQFDPLTTTEIGASETDPDGQIIEVMLRQRHYTPTELVLLARQSGFRIDHVWGGTAGRWGARPVDLDEIEIMMVMTRP